MIVAIKLAHANNEQSGAARTYIVYDQTRVIAYYCVATDTITTSKVPDKIRRNIPAPIPVMVLGRLTVDRAQQQGLGQALLRNAILRRVQATNIADIQALLVQAIDKKTGQFYAKSGFSPSPIEQRIWKLRLQDTRASFLSPT